MLCTLVTSHPYFDGSPLAPDDQLLQSALTRRGIETQVVPWEEPHAWERSDLTLLRSTWNYFEQEHYETFCAWVRATASLTTLLNPLDVVLWNADKHYLAALAKQGVPTIPTMWLPRGTYDLEPLLRATGWPKAVLKPCIGGNSYRARLLTSESIIAEQGPMGQWVVEQDLMLQPYLETITDEGEHSHVFLEGRWSHAFLKRPFQVRKTHALDEPQVFPHQGEMDLAIGVMHTVQRLFPHTYPLLYGRVDLVRDRDGYRVMEVELIEPMLHLEYGSALARLTGAIVQRMHQQVNGLLLLA